MVPELLLKISVVSERHCPQKKNMECALLFNQRYILTFSKPGYVTKKIEFDTHVPQDRLEQGFVPYAIGVRLFPQQDEVNLVVFNQPVGKIEFSDDIDDFDFDVDYTKSIQSQLRKAEEQLASMAKDDAKKAAKQSKTNQNKVRSRAKGKNKNTEDKIRNSIDNNAGVDPNQGQILASTGNQGISVSQAGASSQSMNLAGGGSASGGGNRPANWDGMSGYDNRPDSNAVEFGYDERKKLEATVTHKDISFKEERKDRRTVYFLIVEEAERSTVYKKVVWDWGGVYYFVNETTPITKHLYDTQPYLN